MWPVSPGPGHLTPPHNRRWRREGCRRPPALSQDGWGAPQASTQAQGTGQQFSPDRDLSPRASRFSELRAPIPPAQTHLRSPFTPYPLAGSRIPGHNMAARDLPPSPKFQPALVAWLAPSDPHLPPPTLTQLLPPQDAPPHQNALTPKKHLLHSRALLQGPGLNGPSPQRG